MPIFRALSNIFLQLNVFAKTIVSHVVVRLHAKQMFVHGEYEVAGVESVAVADQHTAELVTLDRIRSEVIVFHRSRVLPRRGYRRRYSCIRRRQATRRRYGIRDSLKCICLPLRFCKRRRRRRRNYRRRRDFRNGGCGVPLPKEKRYCLSVGGPARNSEYFRSSNTASRAILFLSRNRQTPRRYMIIETHGRSSSFVIY